MLIRSQDKCTITDISAINIHINVSNVIVAHINGTYDVIKKLGKYSTKEKAIKVLDMIQKEYEDSLISSSKLPRIYANNKVFQMPEDSEVEI